MSDDIQKIKWEAMLLAKKLIEMVEKNPIEFEDEELEIEDKKSIDDIKSSVDYIKTGLSYLKASVVRK